MHSPSDSTITPTDLDLLRRAGRIARDARRLGASRIRPGARLEQVMLDVEEFIVAQGAGIAFPAQTSRNHCAAHYCPRPGDPTSYEDGDVVKIDVGVHVDGWVADNAETVYLGDDERLRNLVDASRAGLDAALETAGPGVAVREISTAIERAIEARGFRPVYNLTGHGVARWTVHTAPQIPPSPERWSRAVLEPGSAVAIEPFATDGKGTVHEAGRAEIFMLQKAPRKMKGIDEGAWAVIEGLQGLPFARRSFAGSGVSEEAVEATLGRLARIGCLVSFPPLVDADPAVRIAQTEHTIYVGEGGIEVLTA